MPPVIDHDVCNLCGICVDVCPQDVFSLSDDTPPPVAYPDECWHCGACVLDCAVEAIHLKLPLQMHIVPSPASYASPEHYDDKALKKAAAFSRSVVKD